MENINHIITESSCVVRETHLSKGRTRTVDPRHNRRAPSALWPDYSRCGRRAAQLCDRRARNRLDLFERSGPDQDLAANRSS